MKVVLFVFLCMLLSNHSWAQKGQFMTASDFQQLYFSGDLGWKMLWINQAQRTEIEAILKHRFSNLRIRYWQSDQRSGWIFEEIGKELPITVGVIIEENKILNVSVLEFRESRGGEVRYPFFTDQFKQLSLQENQKKHQLDSSIDGITGATLSVKAIKKITILALYCHQQITRNHE